MPVINGIFRSTNYPDNDGKNPVSRLCEWNSEGVKKKHQFHWGSLRHSRMEGHGWGGWELHAARARRRHAPCTMTSTRADGVDSLLLGAHHTPLFVRVEAGPNFVVSGDAPLRVPDSNSDSDCAGT